MDEVAIALFENAFVLPGLDEGIHGLGRMFGLLAGILGAGERDDGLKESEHQRDRHDQVDQDANDRREPEKPLATGARKQQVRNEAIKDQDVENDDEGNGKKFSLLPIGIHVQAPRDEQGEGRSRDLFEYGHRKCGTPMADAEPRFDLLLEDLDVFLELAREELATLGIQARGVGDDHLQRYQEQEYDDQ